MCVSSISSLEEAHVNLGEYRMDRPLSQDRPSSVLELRLTTMIQDMTQDLTRQLSQTKLIIGTIEGSLSRVEGSLCNLKAVGKSYPNDSGSNPDSAQLHAAAVLSLRSPLHLMSNFSMRLPCNRNVSGSPAYGINSVYKRYLI